MQQEIRLYLEKLSKENFDNLIDLRTKFIGSERTRCLDTSIINRLKEEAFSKDSKYEAYLGKIGVDWVAYVIITMSYSVFIALPSLSVDEIFVLDKFRGLGIGRAMFEFCLRKAKKRGCGKIEIQVPNRNKKAKSFFEFNSAVQSDVTCYKMDPFDTIIGKPSGKMTYADFMRIKSKSKIKLARLNSRADDNRQLP
ncbi:MAG: GNAT family N-acetyltransferase [Methanoregula sp.]|jgi:GNAT superfamily N-acetyltransferase|uniref:GNAT family N-acetyltransferase n=1 Tax=Methanoregula sp. TaxID=2052170 RepID=UPI003D0B3128